MTTFELLILMLLISMIAWAMPMVRQANSKLFYYFYILGLTDPLTFLLSYYGLVHSNKIMFALSILNFFLLKNIAINKKIFYFSTALLILINIYLLNSQPNYSILSNVITRIFILIVFLMHTLHFVAATSRLNIFHLMLLFYEATLITKIFIMLNYSETTLVYFVVTSLFQVLIAIWFTIFKEDNPKLHLNLRNI